MVQEPLLKIQRLSVQLPEGADRPLALNNVSIDVARNQIVCVVGESGSGKSMIANAVMGLLPPGVVASAGFIGLDSRDLLKLRPSQMRSVRGARIGMIFQDPMTALNPLKRVGVQISEMFKLHRKMTGTERKKRGVALLEAVHIPDPAKAFRAYPHQLSGGQRQRTMIAMAMALDPDLLIADEPTTALDVTTQAQILKLIREMQQRNGTGVLFITHDFSVVSDIADRVVVLKEGSIVEQGTSADVLQNAQHEYTRALIKAVPQIEPRTPRPIINSALALKATDLFKTFGRPGIFGNGRMVNALRGVSFELPVGRTLGIVGESGSGKSTLARALVRLTDPDSGKVMLGDLDYSALSRPALRSKAGLMQMVFQDPYASLNPRRRVGDLIAQPMTVHGMPADQAASRVEELLALVSLDARVMNRFPHEFSGGQRQRIGIARALALEPKILVADEPVSALDVSIQAQILELFVRLRDTLGLSIIFITHDLRVTAQICDEVAVMKDGKIVEYGPTANLFTNPQHDYTRLLLSSAPGQLRASEPVSPSWEPIRLKQGA